MNYSRRNLPQQEVTLYNEHIQWRMPVFFFLVLFKLKNVHRISYISRRMYILFKLLQYIIFYLWIALKFALLFFRERNSSALGMCPFYWICMSIWDCSKTGWRALSLLSHHFHPCNFQVAILLHSSCFDDKIQFYPLFNEMSNKNFQDKPKCMCVSHVWMLK